MLWWNSKGKDTKELEKELPDELKDFFKENNPDSKQSSKYEVPPQQIKVDKKLASLKLPYNHEFEIYKKKNTIKNISMINCSEMQLKVVDCFKSMNFTSIDNCSQEIKTNKACIEVQSEAFNKLYYNDCYSIEHCDKIRFLVDHLFTKNFGQYGDNITEETMIQFHQQVDKNFDKIWK